MRRPLIYTVLFLSLSLFAWCGPEAPHQTVLVPMRDGKELVTDLYFPPNYETETKQENFSGYPSLLVRSAAGRTAETALEILKYLDEGYLIAIQETRSSADKKGSTMPYLDDASGKCQDGYDAIEWLSKNPYSNGKVGTIGPSTLGISQLLTAPTQHPALVAQYIVFACGSIFHDAAYPQGQLLKHQIEGWLAYYAKDPLHIETIKKNRLYNDFWSQFDCNPKSPQVKVPALFVAGWFDTFLQGTIDAFQNRQLTGGPGAKGKQKLVIGPWAHFWPRVKTLGEFEVPKEGTIPPEDISPTRWFAHYLKNEMNGIEEISPILYYVMGPLDGSPSIGNVWKKADSWPVPSQAQAYYLTANNTLETGKPTLGSTLSYLYDPENPCPTLGGNNLFFETGPKDQSPLDLRADNINFSTSFLESDLEVTGDLTALIYFSTDSDDTDLAVRLTDIYPDGRSILISDNLVRIGSLYYDRGSVARDAVKEPHEVLVKLLPTSLVFAKGHKIGLSISSSNYPRFEKNLNVLLDKDGNPSAPIKKAHNSIYTGPHYPSRLILPVVN